MTTAGGDDQPCHEQADRDRRPSVEDVGQDARVKGREQTAVHEGPVGEDERGAGRGHVRAKQHQAVGREGRQGGEDRERAPSATERQLRRVPAADPDEEQEREQGHGRRQVGGHDLAGQVTLDGDLSEPCLERDETGGGDAADDECRPVTVAKDSHQGEEGHHSAGQGSHRPVAPLDDGVGIVQRRDPRAVAGRPFRAAQPGVGGANDGTDDDEEECHGHGERGECREAGHGSAVGSALDGLVAPMRGHDSRAHRPAPGRRDEPNRGGKDGHDPPAGHRDPAHSALPAPVPR